MTELSWTRDWLDYCRRSRRDAQPLTQDRQTLQRNTLTLCYPADAEPAVGFVSVLSPVGSALVGLQVGSVARWSLPAGDDKAAEILAILFQPESSGDYSM